MFFNACVSHLKGSGTITEDIIKRAEVGYSEQRLQSLQDEWRADHPYLIEFINRLFRSREKVFFLDDIDEECLDQACVSVAMKRDLYVDSIPSSSLSNTAKQLIQEEIEFTSARTSMFMTFFEIGLIGVEAETYQDVRWATSNQSSVSGYHLQDNTLIHVRPAFWSVLGVKS
jgi:hypothetical protein